MISIMNHGDKLDRLNCIEWHKLNKTKDAHCMCIHSKWFWCVIVIWSTVSYHLRLSTTNGRRHFNRLMNRAINESQFTLVLDYVNQCLKCSNWTKFECFSLRDWPQEWLKCQKSVLGSLCTYFMSCDAGFWKHPWFCLNQYASQIWSN